MAWRYCWLAKVPSVLITAIRPLRVASTAACAPGAITPTMGTSNRSRAACSAAAVAVLQAITTSFTSSPTRCSMILSANSRTSCWYRGP